MDLYSPKQKKKFAAEPALYRAQISMTLLKIGREKITRPVDRPMVQKDLITLIKILKEKKCPKSYKCLNKNFVKAKLVQKVFHDKITAKSPNEEGTTKDCQDIYKDIEKFKGKLLWCFREDIKFLDL